MFMRMMMYIHGGCPRITGRVLSFVKPVVGI